MQTSILSEYMAALLKHSLNLDAGREEGNPQHFIDLQRLETRIITAHNDHRINESEYRALYALAMQLHGDYRKALHLD